MIDPLESFRSQDLHTKYDALCKRFDPEVLFLDSLPLRPQTDRSLYHALINRFAEELKSASGITIGTYEAMLYWKLYSQPAAVARLRKSIRYDSTLRNAVSMGLRNFSAEVLRTTRTDSDELVVQVKQLGRYEIWGMKSPTALPVRTTFLHFVDPEYVPIFDKQVLLAVGVAEKRANEKLEVLRYYLPHARELARKYSRHFSAFKDETAIRLVDMAMWVTRGGCH